MLMHEGTADPPAVDTAIVITGGEPADPSVALPAAFVIAADSGLDHAAALGLEADLVIGDMDSVDSGRLARARDDGALVDRHSPDKDATDLELALDAALERGAERVIVVGGGGGRLDHLLANALLLGSPRYRSMVMEWLTGRHRAWAVHDHAELHGRPGDLVTLLPVGGPACGVRTTGLRWRLAGEDLPPGTSRGVSNEMTGDRAAISVEAGTLLAIVTPGGEA